MAANFWTSSQWCDLGRKRLSIWIVFGIGFGFDELGFFLNLLFCSKNLLEQEEVDAVHPADKEKGITLEDFKLIKIHMTTCKLL